MKYLIRGIIIVVLLAILIGAFFTFGSYSDGTRAGTLVKFSRKGVIFKTWEGQLNTGVVGADATQPLSSAWAFSVTDDQLIKKLQEAEGKRVKLHYKEKYYVVSWESDTKNIVDGVEIIP